MFKIKPVSGYVSSWAALWLNWSEYTARFRRGFKYALIFLLATVIIAFISAVTMGFLSSEDDYLNALKSTSATAMGVASPVDIDDKGVHASTGEQGAVIYSENKTSEVDQRQNDQVSNAIEGSSGTESHFDAWVFSICMLEAFIVVVLSLSFSGAFAAVFLSPINPIKFAPFALLDKERCCLIFRCWVCYPSEKFLHKVRVTVGYEYKNMYSESELIFGNKDESRNMSILQNRDCGLLRGVWDLVVPLNEQTGKDLYRIFNEHRDEDPVVKLTIHGSTASGELVARHARYSIHRLLTNYIFASYHFPYESKQDKETIEEYSKRKYGKLWYADFYKVVPLERAIEARRLGAVNCGTSEQGNPVMRLKARKEYKKWVELKDASWNNLSSSQQASEKERIDRFTVQPQVKWRPWLTPRVWWQINRLSKYI